MSLTAHYNWTEIPYSCGCVEYHWADCPIRTAQSDYDAPEPDEYSNLDYRECDHTGEIFDGSIVTDSDGTEWVVCDFCDEKRKWEDVQNGS